MLTAEKNKLADDLSEKRAQEIAELKVFIDNPTLFQSLALTNGCA